MELAELNGHLKGDLPDFVSGLQQNPQTRRILGFVVSTAFEGLQHAERQRRLRASFERRYKPHELAQFLGPVVAMTPAEALVSEPEPAD